MITMFEMPRPIRKGTYTTNLIELVNSDSLVHPQPQAISQPRRGIEDDLLAIDETSHWLPRRGMPLVGSGALGLKGPPPLRCDKGLTPCGLHEIRSCNTTCAG